MTIAWPSVVEALVALLPTLPEFDGVKVFDQEPAPQTLPKKYVTIGHHDEANAGSFSRTDSSSGRPFMDETGQVVCFLVCQTGSVALPRMRTDAFLLVDAWEQALIADPTLGGVLSANATCTLSAQIDGLSNTKGTAEGLVITVTYTTTLA